MPSRLSWPPPRMPPRASGSVDIEARSEVPIPERVAETIPPPAAPRDATIEALHAAQKTPSGEFRISQIRDLLFGDVQMRYEQRLADLENQMAVLQGEARSKLAMVESSLARELGEALNGLSNKVVACEQTDREERLRIEARLEEIETAMTRRVEEIEDEVRAMRSDLDALTEGLRLESKAMSVRMAEEMTKGINRTVQQYVRGEIARLFLALGTGIGRARVEADPTGETTAPREVPQLSDDPGMGELVRWAEELTSGDIKILDPEPEEPTQATRVPRELQR